MIYLIKSGNYLKIGFSKCLQKRLNAYKTHNPNYQLLSYKLGTRTDEKSLHDLCKEYHYNNEWFYDTSFVRETFENYGKKIKIKSTIDECRIITYLNTISWVYKLNSMVTYKLIYKLLEKVNYNSNIINISSKMRKQICKELNISNSSYITGIKQLIELELISGDKGQYSINKEMFWKGDFNQFTTNSIE